MKNKISAKIVADSIDGRGNRITTFVLTYPRIIHAEMMTHRLFSRNAASSRAIPFKKMVESVEEDPFIPIAWQKDHKGMQGTEYFTESEFIDIEPEYAEDPNITNVLAIPHLKSMWLHARQATISMADALNKSKATKQLCNRLLEPYQWYTCLVTTTELENFYKLRCPQYSFGKDTDNPKLWKSRKDAIKDFPDWETRNDLFWYSINESQAEIHIQAIAEAMWDAQNESKPNQLEAGEWHIPFGDRILITWKEGSTLESNTKEAIKIATARAARLSYMTFDGEIDYTKDIALHDTLLASKHASAFEHCCRVLNEEEYNTLGKMTLHPEKGYVFEKGWVDNIRGFISYRRILNI